MQPVTDAVAGFIFEVSVLGAQLPLIVLWLIAASTFFTSISGFSISEASCTLLNCCAVITASQITRVS